MQKIILRTGFLVFFIALIYFTSVGLAVKEILIKSTILFLAFTLALTVLGLLFLRLSGKVQAEMQDELPEQIKRN